MKTGSIYSASDKALFDALNQHQVTNAALRDLFLKRGIIVSKSTSRKALATYFSRFMHDYYDYEALAQLFTPNARREKFTSERIVAQVEVSAFEKAAHLLVDKIVQGGDTASVTTLANGTVAIHINYNATDFNRSEFKQVVQREALITIEQDGDALTLRSQQNDTLDEWRAFLIDKVEEDAGNIDLEVDHISLDHIEDVKIRTRFFTSLIDSMVGFILKDVTDAYVFHPKKDQRRRDADGDVDTGVHISKASLKGEGVLQSEELGTLFAKGFYIWKIVWTSTKKDTQDVYEFEAQFSDQENCRQFSYLPRGFYKFYGPGEINATRTPFPTGDDRELSKLIEATAREVISRLGGAQQGVAGDDQDKVA